MTRLTTSIASLQFKWSSSEVHTTVDREEIRELRIESGSIARGVSPKVLGAQAEVFLVIQNDGELHYCLRGDGRKCHSF